jgi:hypothetical protein
MKYQHLLSAAATLLLLAGCGQTRSEVSEKSQSTTNSILFAGTSAVIPKAKCRDDMNNDLPKNPNIVKFFITEDLLYTLGTEQHVNRAVSIENAEGKDTPQKDPPKDVAKEYIPTYLDIGVPASSDKAQWTQVVIKLKNANSEGIRFMPVRDANGNESATDSRFAVLAQATKIGKFCDRKEFGTDGAGNDVVKFGVVLDKDESVSINIGLLVKDKKKEGYWIPIYLDPNMKNTG